MCKSSTRRTLQICCIVAAVFAAATGNLFDRHAAYAQGSDEGYVDVGLILDMPDHPAQNWQQILAIIVVNQGSITAHDVEVVVSIEYPATLSHFHDEPVRDIISRDLAYVPIGSLSLDDDERTLRWTIPALEGEAV